MELEYLKKLEALGPIQNPSNNQKTRAIIALRHKYPLAELLETAKQSKSTFYHNLKNLKRPDKDMEIRNKIRKIFFESKETYGYRRIKIELRNQGDQINHKKTIRIMKEEGLVSKAQRSKYKPQRGTEHKTAPNIINRNFKATKPLEKVTTDITEFRIKGQKLYLIAYMDMYNGEIICYDISKTSNMHQIKRMLKKIKKRIRKNTKTIMHSDQGWKFTHKTYVETIQEQGWIQSMSRRGNCYDNAIMESFFGTLKTEFYHPNEFKSIEEFIKEIKRYIKNYNEKRIMTRL